MSLLPKNVRYLVLDTETTGVDIDDKVVEVGWVEVDEDFNILNQHQSLIDPQRMIAPAASAVHGLVLDDLKDSPTIEEYFSTDDPSCYGGLITDPVVLIGHRIDFDHRFVKPYITNVVQPLCTLRWVRRLYPNSDNHKLQTMVYALGLPRATEAHRVMSDVMSSYHLCRHICERTGMSLSELVQVSAEPMEIKTMTFGKWKDHDLSEVPAPYFHWMLDKMTLDMDLEFSVKQELQRRKKK